MELSIILPCRNEESSLQECISQIKEVIKENNLDAEIIVSDSSYDSSPEIAKKNKVILIKHDKEGYGIAYLEAFKKSRGKYIFMADCDGTYDFKEIPKFLNLLRKGFDFVIGNRFQGNIEKNAMPWHHKLIGNPVLSGILRLFFKASVKDVHCGMRAISKSSLDKLNLQTTGMEFASEMVVKAVKNKLKISQIPINYYKRKGKSKLKSLTDGWRHLRFMLLYSPLFLFFIPGVISLLIGVISILLFYFSSLEIMGIRLFYHPMFLSSLLIILGYQLIVFSIFAKTYSITHLNEKSKLISKLFNYLSIEKGSFIGLFITFLGVLIYFNIFVKWINSEFGDLNEIKNSIIALTFTIIGIQTVFNSFMLSILGIKNKINY